jgi:hypothetical protein
MWCDASGAYPHFVERALRRVEVTSTGFVLHDELATDAECWHEARFFTRGEFLELGPGRFCVSVEGRSAELSIQAEAPLYFVVAEAVRSVPVRAPLRMLRVTSRDAARRATWRIAIKAGK